MGIAERLGRGCRIGAAGLLLASTVYGVEARYGAGAPAYAAPAVVAPLAIEKLPGDACDAHALAANDDDSTGPVALPFAVNFFGKHYGSVFVNNNGSVTFNGPLATFTPFDVATDVGTPIIAPFFADADTRGPLGGGVHYGATADHHRF